MNAVAAEKAKYQQDHAAEVLRRLDQIGAINLNVLVTKASEVLNIVGANFDDDDGIYRMCYRQMVHIGPRGDIDVVSMVSQLTSLGFEVKPSGIQTGGLQANE